jgi:methylated-DNA-[protein]-cysteine S-methyltransferase
MNQYTPTTAARRGSQRTPEAVLAPLLAPVHSQALGHLHQKLEEAAAHEGLLDIAYTTIDTPVGKLLLAATRRGVVRVAYEVEDHDKVLKTLATRISPRVLRAPGQLDTAVRELDEYFNGTRRSFDLRLDLSLSNGFRQTVQRHLSDIAYGHTESYGDVAEIVGNPRAVRAVGSACANNPLPVVVPCHRVVRNDGSLGGYVGGLEAKQTLLNMERAA